MPFYKYISSSFFFFILVFYFYFVFSSPLVVLQHLGCVGYRAFEGDMEKEGGHPARKQLEQCCGVLKSRFSFLPTILCPGSVRGSYSARHDTNSGQKKKKKKKKKVKYLVHSCSVFIVIVVQGSFPSFPPRLFRLRHTSTRPSPHTLPPHRHTYIYVFCFVFVGYNSRHQAFGSLIFTKTILNPSTLWVRAVPVAAGDARQP